MAARTYAQLECSLTGSKRVRKLSEHSARWAYVCAHLSSFCTYTGLFRYPPEIWAHDAQLSPTQLDAAIQDMVENGLIEHDPEEDYVRLVGWFHKRSGPDNPNRVDSVIADLSIMDDVDPAMFCRAASELSAASVKRSLRWPAEGSGRPQLYKSLKQFLSEVYQDHGTEFLTILREELDAGPATVRGEIAALLPFLTIQSGEPLGKASGRVPPTLAEHETRRDVDETKTKLKQDETKTVPFLRSATSQSAARLEGADLLRKGAAPSRAAINSTISKAARGSA